MVRPLCRSRNNGNDLENRSAGLSINPNGLFMREEQQLRERIAFANSVLAPEYRGESAERMIDFLFKNIVQPDVAIDDDKPAHFTTASSREYLQEDYTCL